MSNIKEKSYTLISEHHRATSFFISEIDATEHAIISTKNTIEGLTEVIKHDKERYGITSRGASIQIAEQNEILKELESRL